jgi:hypothetical protein
MYLIPKCALRELCEKVFVDQLAGWFNDRTSWPRNCGLDTFREWFDFHVSTI